MVLSAIGVSMAVSFLISFLGGRRFATFWPKFAFFLAASVVGFFLFPIFCGLWAAATDLQTSVMAVAVRKEVWNVLGGVVAMAYVGAWRFQTMIDRHKK
jgi:hypothetical protein